jgi:hypothetical protein
MNHDDATKLMAERYILDELEPSERDAFEEHYFECTLCANDVRDLARFREGVRTPEAWVKEPPVAQVNWWAAAAGLVVAVGLAYRFIALVPSQPHRGPVPIARPSVDEQVIDIESTRAGQNAHHIRGDRPVALFFTIPPEPPAPAYVCELHDAAGAIVGSPNTVTAEQARERIRMPVAPGTLRTGSYNIVIRASDQGNVAEYPFDVDVQ